MYQWWKYSGFSGVVFVILFIIAAFVLQSGRPDYDAPVEDIRRYFVDHGNRFLVGNLLLGFGSILFFVPFVSGLAYFIRLAEAGPQINGRIVLVAGILLVAMAGAASVFSSSLAFGLAKGTSDDTIIALSLLDYVGFSGLPFAMALLIGAASVVFVFDNLFWPWLGFVGFVVAIIDFITPLGLLWPHAGIFQALDAFSGLSFMVWMLLLSYGLLTRYEQPNLV